MQKFKGKFCKTSNGEIVYLQLEDADSGCRLIEIELDYESFGKYLAMNTIVDCNYVYFKDCPVGKNREVKRELIETSSMFPKEDEIKSILEKYEVDGWEARDRDFKNSHYHKRVDDKHYHEVVFIRFV